MSNSESVCRRDSLASANDVFCNWKQLALSTKADNKESQS
ncbi:hypothetical protein VCHA27O13_110051 [Vibrio chagasii]|nr:hypothetical protein VCHA27O13_110051 [Vibrio chagasii]CAH6865355.1 hypothetical protein VCHA36O157_240004 [Vibrio chagasii]CAH6868466.1 hypothetical protein VCHA34P115_250052 [Vibrio chagasii]